MRFLQSKRSSGCEHGATVCMNLLWPFSLWPAQMELSLVKLSLSLSPVQHIYTHAHTHSTKICAFCHFYLFSLSSFFFFLFSFCPTIYCSIRWHNHIYHRDFRFHSKTSPFKHRLKVVPAFDVDLFFSIYDLLQHQNNNNNNKKDETIWFLHMVIGDERKNETLVLRIKCQMTS